ncbi:hypothetical protein J3R82DRAFT_8454 [Butyriboletus roseoflavus]|nr:hypothetical protein J3R82DRAFT_8454 [Butyriboletus roseoflavus]
MAFLIGGFGASDWLWSQLQSYFKSQGIELSRPSRVCVFVLSGHRERILLIGYSHKAVPDGALSFLVDHLVKARVARVTYGTGCAVKVDEENPEHLSEEGNLVHEILRKVGSGFFVKGYLTPIQERFCRVFKPMNKRNSVIHFPVLEWLSRTLATSCYPSCAIEALCQIQSGRIASKAGTSPSV